MDSFRELYSPGVVRSIPGNPAYTIESVYPFRQVMVILSVTVPFQTFIKVIGKATLVHLLIYPQAALRRVHLSLLLIEAADPAGS